MDSIEKMWEEILSRDPDRIRIAYNSLTSEEKIQIFDHLKKMAHESGWHQEQKLSAESAIKEISCITH